MKNLFLVLGLLGTAVAFKDIQAEGIRLYQEDDFAILSAMVASNEDLLVPEGDNLEDRVLKTLKFFGSKNYITKVFVKDDKLVGFITYQKEVPSLNWLLKWFIGSPGVIQLLNVHEEYRRQGIGAALLHDALEYMKTHRFDTVLLQTKVANASARVLYEKNGFVLLFPIALGESDCWYKCKLVNPKI